MKTGIAVSDEICVTLFAPCTNLFWLQNPFFLAIPLIFCNMTVHNLENNGFVHYPYIIFNFFKLV